VEERMLEYLPERKVIEPGKGDPVRERFDRFALFLQPIFLDGRGRLISQELLHSRLSKRFQGGDKSTLR
jgi:hypothetical protein